MSLNERYMFFDSIGDDDRDYTSGDFALCFQKMFTNGIFRDPNPLIVTADGLTMNLTITAGSALIGGRFYELTEEGTIAAPVSSSDLRYHIVLRLDLSTEAQSITLNLKPGTATALPELRRDNSVWELAVASVTTRANRPYITQDDITDTRADKDLCGYVRRVSDPPDPPYYPPSVLPQLLWTYTLFPGTLTDEQRAEIEGNPNLMALFWGSRFSDYLTAWGLIATYETAGTYTFTVPARFGAGVKYKLGAFIIGGGGGGAKASIWATAGSGGAAAAASGGASGYTTSIELEVTPGQMLSVVVGAGGAGLPLGSGGGTANNGGSSSFNGITANGGTGGLTISNWAYSVTANAVAGGVASNSITTGFPDGRYANSAVPSGSKNPFTGEYPPLAAGGGAAAATGAQREIAPVLSNNLKAGNGVASVNANGPITVYGEAATSPGCGGGSAAAATTTNTGSSVLNTASGSGAAGAVYVYARR